MTQNMTKTANCAMLMSGSASHSSVRSFLQAESTSPPHHAHSHRCDSMAPWITASSNPEVSPHPPKEASPTHLECRQTPLKLADIASRTHAFVKLNHNRAGTQQPHLVLVSSPQAYTGAAPSSPSSGQHPGRKERISHFETPSSMRAARIGRALSRSFSFPHERSSESTSGGFFFGIPNSLVIRALRPCQLSEESTANKQPEIEVLRRASKWPGSTSILILSKRRKSNNQLIRDD